MITPGSIEELAGFVEQDGKKVFLFVADWCQRARADKTLLHTDLIHPSPEGVRQYTNSIDDAFHQWANHRKRPVTQCGV